jgi:hypothetical protein
MPVPKDATFFTQNLRCAGVMLAVRAGPPFNPPSRPSATAAGFFFSFIAMHNPAKNRNRTEDRKLIPLCLAAQIACLHPCVVHFPA